MIYTYKAAFAVVLVLGLSVPVHAGRKAPVPVSVSASSAMRAYPAANVFKSGGTNWCVRGRGNGQRLTARLSAANYALSSIKIRLGPGTFKRSHRPTVQVFGDGQLLGTARLDKRPFAVVAVRPARAISKLAFVFTKSKRGSRNRTCITEIKLRGRGTDGLTYRVVPVVGARVPAAVAGAKLPSATKAVAVVGRYFKAIAAKSRTGLLLSVTYPYWHSLEVTCSKSRARNGAGFSRLVKCMFKDALLVRTTSEKVRAVNTPAYKEQFGKRVSKKHQRRLQRVRGARYVSAYLAGDGINYTCIGAVVSLQGAAKVKAMVCEGEPYE